MIEKQALTSHRIHDLLHKKSFLDHTVTVQGWVRTQRISKAGISFINLHDGSCFAPIQIVAPNTLPNYDDISKLTSGCALSVTGKLVTSSGKEQAVEILAENITIVGWVDNPETYPIQAKHHTLEYLREVAHLRPRTNTIGALTRIRHCVAQTIHRFFDEHGFFWVNTPIITASDCEGAGEMFRVSTLDLMNLPYLDHHDHQTSNNKKIDFNKDFLGKETFLTVSGQLNAEAYCSALSKVYTFGPTFRAENSNTSRHLAEFWMVEPEIAFANLNDIAQLAEALLKNICATVLAKQGDDIQFFADRIDKDCIRRLDSMIGQPFARIDYTDAVEALQKSNKSFTFPVEWGRDLQSEHERYLAEELFGKPVIVYNYPKEIKSFYMRLNEDGKTVAAMDILAPCIGEIIGGSQREERLEILDQRIAACGLDKNNYSWYRDLRRYGSVPHAGFGLGFERLLSYLTGLHNVRDVIPFPRTPGQVSF